MMKAKTADDFFVNAVQYGEELGALREIALSTGLVETVKWGHPVYTFDGKNIVGLGGFKSYFGLWFFQGALLKDPAKRLVNAQEGVTTAQRQMRFSSAGEIDRGLIVSYIEEAVANERAGNKIKPRSKPLVVPSELQAALDSDSSLASAFDGLGLTKKRDYCEYIEVAKRAETRQQRLEKIIPMIREGRGMNDRYR
ncbi:MAG TPA: YdeI/OmpD-associated family protein [Pyrinomonadaceae bacterium]|nr:YdeI/OmpD-associated family protein [Pyrinomonadaceae bacterium]